MALGAEGLGLCIVLKIMGPFGEGLYYATHYLGVPHRVPNSGNYPHVHSAYIPRFLVSCLHNYQHNGGIGFRNWNSE